MKAYVCPRDWTFWTHQFTPDHLLSLQNPGAKNVSELRPPWVPAENHFIAYFYDVDVPGDPDAPSKATVEKVVEWLLPRCGSGSEARLIIHCDAGLGRSPAVAYIAWSIHLGPGREEEAFQAMKVSCRETRLVPNTVIVAHADDILKRRGALRQPLTAWNRRVPWRRSFR